jgi:hypothetical protein
VAPANPCVSLSISHTEVDNAGWLFEDCSLRCKWTFYDNCGTGLFLKRKRSGDLMSNWTAHWKMGWRKRTSICGTSLSGLSMKYAYKARSTAWFSANKHQANKLFRLFFLIWIASLAVESVFTSSSSLSTMPICFYHEQQLSIISSAKVGFITWWAMTTTGERCLSSSTITGSNLQQVLRHNQVSEMQCTLLDGKKLNYLPYFE